MHFLGSKETKLGWGGGGGVVEAGHKLYQEQQQKNNKKSSKLIISEADGNKLKVKQLYIKIKWTCD